MNKTETDIAQDYISHHRIDNPDGWLPWDKHGDDKLIHIFNNIMGDVYGECREESPDQWEIEIDMFSAKDSIPFIFEFTYHDTGVNS